MRSIIGVLLFFSTIEAAADFENLIDSKYRQADDLQLDLETDKSQRLEFSDLIEESFRRQVETHNSIESEINKKSVSKVTPGEENSIVVEGEDFSSFKLDSGDILQ